MDFEMLAIVIKKNIAKDAQVLCALIELVNNL